jgi:Na+-driven multidrug efflux pump
MKLFRLLRRYRAHPAFLIGLTLMLGGLFKVSAFAREAFIAARFGLSAVTDTYFGLQQFPITWATFMGGAFALAFTPAYAEAHRRSGTVSWLPGLNLLGLLISSAMTVMMLVIAPLLLRLFAASPNSAARNTLLLLSVCYAPIFYVGILSGVWTALGRNLAAMTISGLPYLVMTVSLLVLYAAGWLNNLGLPISMAAGFVLVGVYAFIQILRMSPCRMDIRGLGATWKIPEFRLFLRELTASSIENLGFAGNQLLTLFFLARAGTGAISANNCGMRIGMLGFSLLAQPLAQLVQAKLCAGAADSRPAVFRRWLVIVTSGVAGMATILYLFRVSVIHAVYMHGKFQNAELNLVLSILPPWIAYFVVLSLNAIISRYMFIDGKGTFYVRRQLGAYAAANLLRLAIGSSFGAAWIIWCSVVTEGIVLLLNLRTTLAVPNTTGLPLMVGVEEA